MDTYYNHCLILNVNFYLNIKKFYVKIRIIILAEECLNVGIIYNGNQQLNSWRRICILYNQNF